MIQEGAIGNPVVTVDLTASSSETDSKLSEAEVEEYNGSQDLFADDTELLTPEEKASLDNFKPVQDGSLGLFVSYCSDDDDDDEKEEELARSQCSHQNGEFADEKENQNQVPKGQYIKEKRSSLIVSDDSIRCVDVVEISDDSQPLHLYLDGASDDAETTTENSQAGGAGDGNVKKKVKDGGNDETIKGESAGKSDEKSGKVENGNIGAGDSGKENAECSDLEKEEGNDKEEKAGPSVDSGKGDTEEVGEFHSAKDSSKSSKVRDGVVLDGAKDDTDNKSEEAECNDKSGDKDNSKAEEDSGTDKGVSKEKIGSSDIEMVDISETQDYEDSKVSVCKDSVKASNIIINKSNSLELISEDQVETITSTVITLDSQPSIEILDKPSAKRKRGEVSSVEICEIEDMDKSNDSTKEPPSKKGTATLNSSKTSKSPSKSPKSKSSPGNASKDDEDSNDIILVDSDENSLPVQESDTVDYNYLTQQQYMVQVRRIFIILCNEYKHNGFCVFLCLFTCQGW